MWCFPPLCSFDVSIVLNRVICFVFQQYAYYYIFLIEISILSCALFFEVQSCSGIPQTHIYHTIISCSFSMKCILLIDIYIVLRRELFVLFFNNIHPIFFLNRNFKSLKLWFVFLISVLHFITLNTYLPHYQFLRIFSMKCNL